MSPEIPAARSASPIVLLLKKMMQIRLLLSVPLVLILAGLLAGHPAMAQSAPQVPDNFLERPSGSFSIPFYWQGEPINGKWETHTAMLLPVKLPHCPRQFYMQFDLGSPSSLFYKNKLAAIQTKYPASVPQQDSAGRLQHVAFWVGNSQLRARQMELQQFDSTSINWDDPAGIEIIGTIGADLIDGKIAIIDYPNQTLRISTELSRKTNAKATWTDFVYAQRRILLPATIKGKSLLLYFDTGSSLYELLTDQKTAESLAIPGVAVLQSQVRSWDKYLTAHSLSSSDSIAMGGHQLPIRRVTYMEGVNSAQVAQMMKMGIGGMTGNTLFLDYQLLLDTRKKKFALIR